MSKRVLILSASPRRNGNSDILIATAGEDAFKMLKGDNKELMIIPGASHVDLYDRTDIIPFDKLESFFTSGKQVNF